MTFGDVIRSAAAPASGSFGIGGDVNTIWHCNDGNNRIYELDTSDFSIIRSASSPAGAPTGIGGDANTIWHCDSSYYEYVYKLSTSDFSVISTAAAPETFPGGIGGKNNKIWHCDFSRNRVYELNITNFSVIRWFYSYGAYPSGIGGDANTIWYCNDDYPTPKIHELSTANFSSIRTADPPAAHPSGIGGDANTIWYCDDTKIYELNTSDAPPTHTISGNVKDSDGNNLNNVTITFENSTNYSTSTNVSGNYSQAVNPDVYIVTASLSGYFDSSASVDVSAGDQTQNFILLQPVISGNVKDQDGNNLSNVTITLKNGTNYSTPTDSNGNYTQAVNTDIYDVVATKHGYPSEYATVDASSSDQTQNFILRCIPREIVPHEGAGSRKLIPQARIEATEREPAPVIGRDRGNLC